MGWKVPKGSGVPAMDTGKTFGKRWSFLAALASLVLTAPAARAQSGREVARTIAHAEAYASIAPVPRKRTFEVAVVARIKSNYHINAHKVLDPYLIPTKVESHFPPGFRLLSTNYPAGELREFSFSKKKLAVYTGQVTVRMKVEAESMAPLGTQDLSLAFRYQACNNAMCLPPVSVPVSLHIAVAKAGTHAKPAHREIFHHK